LLGEHQAQLINYLKVSDISVGLLVNFGKRKLEYKRLHQGGRAVGFPIPPPSSIIAGPIKALRSRP
jgi:PD-(D/E)XK nuclease superfamily